MRRVLPAVAVVAALIAGLWWLSNRGTSPEQRVADAAPPPAPWFDVELEERILRETTVMRGTVVAVDPVSITAPAFSDRIGVVTTLPLGVGDTVESGALLAVISDRPVIALQVSSPFYRSLTLGDAGPDVSRLQRSLADLGIDVAETGVFDDTTHQAVEALYRRHGFTPADDRTVPFGELVGIPSLPATVTAAPLTEGARAEGTILSLTAADLVVETRVDPVAGTMLAPGVTGTGGEAGEWTVRSIDNSGRDDAGQTVVRWEATPSLEPGTLGTTVRVEAELAATETAVLAALTAAIRSRADTTVLRVVGDDGNVADVAVTTGRAIGGWVEIVASETPLPAGTRVRVG